MNRRCFIKTLLALASIKLTLNSRLVSANTKPFNIIIIGAGIAGLAAANQLQANGHKVKILEARNRLGGRIWTNREMGIPVDMGASWIHGVEGNPIKKLANEFNIKTSETDFDNVKVFDYKGSNVSENNLEEIYEAFEELVKEVEDYSDEIENDISIGHALKKVLSNENLSKDETYALNYAKMAYVVESGAELEELSLLHADQDEAFAGEDELFPGGYDQITSMLANNIDIQLNSNVIKIEHNKNNVVITTTDNRITADIVIVTVPLGVLKSKKIQFVPELPAKKQKAINKLEMGVLNKVALHYPEKFWSDDSEFIGYISNTYGEFPEILNLAYYTNHNILLALTGGKFARDLEKISNEQIKNQFHNIMIKIYGPSIPKPDDIIVSRWVSDQFSYGSYSHIPAGAKGKHYDRIAKPIKHKRLLFAGEASNRKFPATVHGAYLSGIREAERILKTNYQEAET